MYGQALALAALSAVGAVAAPQCCACSPNQSVSALANGPGYSGAPSTVTLTQTATATVTSVVNQSGSGVSVPTQTVTETSTITQTSTLSTTTETSTITQTQTVTSTESAGATHTPVAPTASPYYPTYGTGQSGVAGQTGSAAAKASHKSKPPHPFGYSHPVPIGTPKKSSSSTPTPSHTPHGHHTPGSYSKPTPGSFSKPTPGSHSHYTPVSKSTPGVVASSSAYTPPSYGQGSSSSSASVAASTASSSSASVYASSSAASSAPSSAAPSSTGSPSSNGSPSATGQFPQQTSVTNDQCFQNGAANKTTADTAGQPPQNSYQCYSGPASNFPSSDKWTSYDDMKNVHKNLGQTWCSSGTLNTADQTNMIFEAIDAVGAASEVDKRVILAQIVQESSGCVNVPDTNNGVENRGIMQSYNGAAFVGNSASPEQQYNSILQMVSDGVQGTHYLGSTGGDGLLQSLDKYGDFFTSARAYNSGPNGIDKSNLSNAMGATASYCSDTANYLQGWDGVSRGSCSF